MSSTFKAVPNPTIQARTSPLMNLDCQMNQPIIFQFKIPIMAYLEFDFMPLTTYAYYKYLIFFKPITGKWLGNTPDCRG